MMEVASRFELRRSTMPPPTTVLRCSSVTTKPRNLFSLRFHQQQLVHALHPLPRTSSALVWTSPNIAESRSSEANVYDSHYRWQVKPRERFGPCNGLRRNAVVRPLPPWRTLLLAGRWREESSCCRAKNNWFGGREESGEEPVEKKDWSVLKRWDIPWDGKVTSLSMVAWLVSFLFTGLFVSVLAAQVGFGRRQILTTDDQALYVFLHQLAQTIAGLAVVNNAVKPYKPLSPDLFTIEWQSPFNLQRGWILWGGIGILCAGAAVTAASYITFSINGQQATRDDADALVQLLPLIGASPLSTISLIGVTGVFAPILEETIFRGFLMTSLTKWMPTPAAIVLSAFVFAGAHFTPGEFPQLLALGTILGLSYAQTRNLLTPILIHSIWNSGVVVLLAILRLQGYDIKELL